MALSDEQRELIRLKLLEKGANLPCPRCKSNKFVVVDGYFNNSLDDDIGSTHKGGVGIPTAVLVCSNCGYISQHALGILGLLPEEKRYKEGS